MTQALTLVSHRLCPFVQRAAIALGEKGVRFERIDIDLEHKPDWFLALSPLGKVPVLRIGGTDDRDAAVFESNVICEYIEETQPGEALHPADPLLRAEHRAWMEFASSLVMDIYAMETATAEEQFAAKREAVVAKLARTDAALDEGPYFGGDRFSLVDAAFAPAFRYFELFDELVDLKFWQAVPKVCAWRSRLAQRPSVVAAVASGYREDLRSFLARKNSYLLSLAA